MRLYQPFNIDKLNKSDTVLLRGTEVQTKVIQMVLNGSKVPLVTTVVIFVSKALLNNEVISRLIPLAVNVSESLVHGCVGNHILVMRDTMVVSNVGVNIVSKLSVTHARRTIVPQLYVVDARMS
jgi:hypothetical protein